MNSKTPLYDHVAVLVAELLNGFIPLVAIQLHAIQIEEQVALIFTVVLDHRLGLAPEEEEEQGVTDRTYWEKRSLKTTVDMADEVLRLLKTFDQELASNTTSSISASQRTISLLILSSFDRKRLL